MSERLRCFIIMPYSKESDFIYSAAIAPVLKELPEYDIMMLRADMMPRNMTIKAHVEKAVQSADFCIADMTGHNPNVMYEVGFATAIDKPLVLTRKRGSELIPADISSIATLEYDEQSLDMFRERLSIACLQAIGRAELNRTIKQETRQAFTGIGLSRIEPDFVDKFMASIQGEFSALISSPAIFVRDFLPKIELAQHADLAIRLLIPDPEADFTSYRARKLALNVAQYRTELWQALESLLERAKSLAIDLRLTDAYIPNSIYLSENIGILVPELSSRSYQVSIAMVFDRNNSEVFSVLKHQFEQAWSSAVAISVFLPSRPKDLLKF
jgi:hypothetical protein